MKRTTIRLEDDLLDRAKEAAHDSGQTLTSLISEAIVEKLARMQQPQKARHVMRLPRFSGQGLRPGISLDSTSELLDTMEHLDAAP